MTWDKKDTIHRKYILSNSFKKKKNWAPFVTSHKCTFYVLRGHARKIHVTPFRSSKQNIKIPCESFDTKWFSQNMIKITSWEKDDTQPTYRN